MSKDLHSFYYDILNISKKNNNKELDVISDIVSHNKIELLNIAGSVEGLCKVIANNMSVELNKNAVMHWVLNTKDILNSYEHVFIVACFKQDNDLKYVLLDPTYEQFVTKENHVLLSSFTSWPSLILTKTDQGKKLLQNLLNKGYSDIDETDINLYLGSFINEVDVNKVGFKLDSILVNGSKNKSK